MVRSTLLVAAVASLVASSTAFVPAQRPAIFIVSTTELGAKGFGSGPQKKEKSDGQIKREEESSRYDEIAQNAGGQEYSVYVRQFGSDDTSWMPCGAIAVPRGAQVSDAIYANEDALKSAIVRTYPKLKGYEPEFEFGFNLKVYPDDPIDVATKSAPKAQGMSFGNWVSTLFSPVDVSSVNKPTPPPSS